MGIWEEKRNELEKNEPFSDTDKAAYQERDLDFIRDIQLKKGVSLKAAKKEFNTYLNSSKGSKKKLKMRQDIREMLQTSSPPTHSPPIQVSEQHIRPKVKKKRKSVKKKKGINIKKSQPIKTAIKNTKSPKVLKRLKSASKKYPAASAYELRHGVNSIASQEYRLRRGKGRNYNEK